MTMDWDWKEWHHEYDDPGSELSQRSRLVQEQVAATVFALPPGPVTVVSICGGQGRELIGGLEHTDRRDDVGGRLVELDAANVVVAREHADAMGLSGLEIRQADASISNSYAGLPRADLVVLSGVFGHLSLKDRRSTIGFLPQICRTGATVLATTYEVQPERTTELREIFSSVGFTETGWAVTPANTFGLLVERFDGEERQLETDARLFRFGSSNSGQR